MKPAVVGSEHFTDGALDRSALREIQKKITEKRDRNLFSRAFYAKSDKETIATWKSDLNGILHTFNVRFVAPMWLLLTVRS